MNYPVEVLREFLHLNTTGISRNHVLANGLGSFVNSGLEVVAICEHGGYRSRTLSDSMTYHGHPTARLEKGLSLLSSDNEENRIIIDNLHVVPYVAVIFSEAMYFSYEEIFWRLSTRSNAIHFNNIDIAESELTKLLCQDWS